LYWISSAKGEEARFLSKKSKFWRIFPPATLWVGVGGVHWTYQGDRGLGELFSIALFDQLLDQYRNTPLEGDLRRIFGKIVQCLPGNVNVEANFLNTQMAFIPDQAGAIDREAFTTVFAALKGKRTIQFEYRSLSQSAYAKRAADPYHAD
jgi:hypothetical protein